MSNLPRSLKASNERKMRVFMASDASDWNVGKGSLEVILVKARYGTSKSCGMSLRPSRICCATQKASVETPGAIDADHVV